MSTDRFTRELRIGWSQDPIPEPFPLYRWTSVKYFRYLNHRHQISWTRYRQSYLNMLARFNTAFYDAYSNNVKTKSYLDRSNEDPFEYRFLIQAYDGNRLNLTESIRSWMASLEKDLGDSLDWIACDHYDTDVAHSHLIVRCVTDSEIQFALDDTVLQNGLRTRLRSIIEDQIGPLTPEEIYQDILQSLNKAEITLLDFEFDRLANEEANYVIQDPLLCREIPIPLEIQEQRLRQLASFGLAQSVSVIAWKIHTELLQKLRMLRTEHKILSEMSRSLGIEREQCFIFRRDTDSHQNIQGRIVGSGISNELLHHRYIILQRSDDEYWHVDLRWDPVRWKPGQTFDTISLTKNSMN